MLGMQLQELRESVTFTSEGQKIFGVLHKPVLEVSKKYPAIIVCHGFAGQKTGRYRFYVVLAEELAKKGIAVLRFDFRGCGDSEGDFSDTTLSGQVEDALKALEFLKNDPDIDPERLGICGRSLGGAVAVLTAKKFKSIKSLALFAPMFSADSWRKKWELFKDSKEAIVMDGQFVGKEFLKELFELRLNEDLKESLAIPLLHIHAEKDTVVTSEHKEKYLTARLKATAPTETLSLPNSDHEFTDVKERMEGLEKVVSWFSHTL